MSSRLVLLLVFALLTMQIEKYSLKVDPCQKVFAFVSEGRFGKIQKVIKFQLTTQPNLYNLAFGDLNSDTNEIDDLTVTNNGDTEKVLGTVVAALYIFFCSYPGATVYATGSTDARTRLYRMGISKFYEEAVLDFYLFGLKEGKTEVFKMGKNYDGFLVQQKIRKLL